MIILIHISSISYERISKRARDFSAFCGWRHLSHDPAIITIRGAKKKKKKGKFEDKKQKLHYSLLHFRLEGRGGERRE
jgi:hypothetical protein